MGIYDILALILYFLIIGFLGIITSDSLTKEDIIYRIVSYFLSSIMFAGIVINSINSNDYSNFDKQIYKYEKYVIKTGTDKDTIIIDKKH